MKIKQAVLKVLEDNPKARNSDLELIYEIWIMQGFGVGGSLYFRSVENFRKAIHPKTIIEWRRQLQREQEALLRSGSKVSKIIVADKEITKLRALKGLEKGTHIFREIFNKITNK